MSRMSSTCAAVPCISPVAAVGFVSATTSTLGAAVGVLILKTDCTVSSAVDGKVIASMQACCIRCCIQCTMCHCQVFCCPQVCRAVLIDLTLCCAVLCLLHARFTYCALLACSILGRMQSLDVPAAVEFVKACKNFDGGFGCTPGGIYLLGRKSGFACVWATAL